MTASTILRTARTGGPARVLLAAGIVGTIDLAYSFAINGAAGVAPEKVLQFIASGLLRPAAFSAGGVSAAVGTGAHFLLMTVFASALAWRMPQRLASLHPLMLGAAAGAALFVVMTFVVVPLSLSPPLPPMSIVRLLLDIMIHVVVIGPITTLIVLGPRHLA